MQVTFLSIITNFKGDTLLPTRLQGIRAQNRTSRYDWPRQQRPNDYSWKLWTTILFQPFETIIPSQEIDQIHDSSIQIPIFLDRKRYISNR